MRGERSTSAGSWSPDDNVGTADVELTDVAAIVVLCAEHDLMTIETVEAAIHEAEQAGCARVVVDLSRCSFIDSTVIRALCSAHRRAVESERGFALVVPATTAPPILRVIEITALDGVMAIHSSREAAIGDDDGVGAAGRDDDQVLRELV